MSTEASRTEVAKLLSHLRQLLRREPTESAVWQRIIAEAVETANDPSITDDDAMTRIRTLHRRMYSSGRNLSDFLLWDDDPKIRQNINDDFNGTRSRLFDIFG